MRGSATSPHPGNYRVPPPPPGGCMLLFSLGVASFVPESSKGANDTAKDISKQDDRSHVLIIIARTQGQAMCTFINC